MKTLYIIRGLPGAGKTTFAKTLADTLYCNYYEADQYFTDSEGNYNFDASKLPFAHGTCLSQVEIDMQMDVNEKCGNIIVSNTSVTESSLTPYLNLAEQYGYRVVSMIIENRHGNESVHNVPTDKVNQMRNKFSIKL